MQNSGTAHPASNYVKAEYSDYEVIIETCNVLLHSYWFVRER